MLLPSPVLELQLYAAIGGHDLRLFHRDVCGHHPVRSLDALRIWLPSAAQATETMRHTLLPGVGGHSLSSDINIGAYWANIELAAEDAGLDGDWAGRVISWTVLLCSLAVRSHVCPAQEAIMIGNTSDFRVDDACRRRASRELHSCNLCQCGFVQLWILLDVYQMGGVWSRTEAVALQPSSGAQS